MERGKQRAGQHWQGGAASFEWVVTAGLANAAPEPHLRTLRETQAYQALVPVIQGAMPRPFNHPCQAADKELLPCQSLEWVWPTHLLPPGSARTGYPFQLPVVHPCQSNKGCVLQGLVQSTVLDTAPAPSPLLHTGEVLGIWNWRRNSLLGEFPSHHLPPGKHPGTDRQGRRSWQPASTEKP